MTGDTLAGPSGVSKPPGEERGEACPLVLSSWLEAFRPLGDLHRLLCDPDSSLPSSLTWRSSWP